MIGQKEESGSWPRQDPAGVFFRTALLDYTLYRQYFPLWALSQYESRRLERFAFSPEPPALAPSVARWNAQPPTRGLGRGDEMRGGKARRASIYAVVLGLLACLALTTCRPPRSRPDIVMITLDTTRADRLGCYGNTDEITPNIDRLAQESVMYSRATSTTGWTLPAHVSLFTGKFTSSHGARFDPNGPLILSKVIGERYSGFRAWGMGPEEITLATLLKENGYRTGAVVAGPWMKKIMGLDRGFEFYDDTGITALNGRLAHSVTDAAIAWLNKPDPRPFFLFLNYFDPHGPYRPPPEFRKHRPKIEAGMSAHWLEDYRRNWLYNGEIRYMDHHIGRFFDALREKGLYDGTLVIVTADHGELLGEHGAYTHGARLHQPIVHIPLIVKYPGAGQTASTNDERAQLVDILPTVLEELELPIPDGVQGDALDRLDHPVVSEVYPLPLVQDYDGATRVLFEDSFKFIQRTRGRNLLFDLDRDPGEEDNLLAQFPERAMAMEQTLIRYLDSLPVSVHDATPREVDKETEEALRGLGYVD